MFKRLAKIPKKTDLGVDRKTMEAALKEKPVRTLRELGFKGSFPNFYRECKGFVSLVNFQFYSSGGSFCVNLGYAGPNRENIFFRPEVETKRLNVAASKERFRLGSGRGGDNWFSFGKTNYNEYRGEPQDVIQITEICSSLFRSQAEEWWKEKQSQFITG